MIVVADDRHRENEGDLVLAAEHASPEALAFMIRYSSGIICAPMPHEWADRLHLAPMVPDSLDPLGTAFTVSVDALGSGTGVSAASRCLTGRTLADPSSLPARLRRPGHVFPLRASNGGVLKRAGHTEASVDLLGAAGCSPVALIAELTGDDGTMLDGAASERFAAQHGLRFLRISDLISYRLSTTPMVYAGECARLPTQSGEFVAHVYRSTVDSLEHLVLCLGDVAAQDAPYPVLVRVHSECLTGDAIGSLRCDCGSQLQESLRLIARAGRGVVVYLRGHEGRGVGLGHKMRAYSLQDQGLDTVAANVELDLPGDLRDYGVAAQILSDLGVYRLRLLSNNPEKQSGLSAHGLDVVERVPLVAGVTPENVGYLETKRDRLGHTFDPRIRFSTLTARDALEREG